MDSLQVMDINTLNPMEAAGQLLKLTQLKRQVDSKLVELRNRLLEETRKSGVITLKTEKYLITRQTRRTIKVIDDTATKEYLEERGVPVEMKTVVNMDLMGSVIKNYPDNIPGVDYAETEYVTVRVPKEKYAVKRV